MSEETAVATIPAEPEVPQEEVFVLARNQREMEAAQTKLVGWARGRIARVVAETTEARENLRIAEESKWRTAPFKALVKKAENQLHFYEKLQLAFEAGYCLVPDMDIDVFAVRTTRAAPSSNDIHSEYRWNRPNAQTTNSPPAGEGRYVSDEALVMEQKNVEEKDGKTITKWHSWAEEFKDADFPFKLAKAAILTATAEAMALKVFDEIGVLPRRRAADPMVIGRIGIGSGHQRRNCNFVIAWFVDTHDIR